MSDQFDWHVADEDNVKPFQSPGSPENGGRGRGFWLFTAALLLFIIGGWGFSRYQLYRSEMDLNRQVQKVIDFETEAFLARDGELFFSTQLADQDWMSAQLQPASQAMYRAGLKVTSSQQYEDYIWANVVWSEEEETRQRVMFFRWQNGRLLHVPTAPTYWGEVHRYRSEWGLLKINEIDQVWVDRIIGHIGAVIRRVCRDECLADSLPLTVVLTPDFSQTAVPGTIHIPSPRLFALDETGQPSRHYWQTLTQLIENELTPATITFAVPPPRLLSGRAVIDYDRAAAEFMALHPHITVEIVHLEELPDDLSLLAAAYDGAAVVPTQAMLAAGLVRDLSHYIGTDPDFDVSDFYPQIWQGAKWQDRIWFMPQAAGMQVLFYDKAAYQQADMFEPSLRWTWDEMEQDVSTIVAAQPDTSDLAWGYLDTELGSLFSYAYNWNNECTEAVTVLCRHPLQTENIAVALDWYQQMVVESQLMPDITPFAEGDLETTLLNFQTARRQAAVWVDLPLDFEHQYLMASVGVVPFPGSDRFDGITPLRVQGSFISQNSQRPLAMWQWLKFLSYQRPMPRMIPARPSVATEIDYWVALPRPLGDVMRTAFPFARPITIAEQDMLTWEMVTAVVNGELSAAAAANRQPNLRWFNNP